jgi:hypothetical protein
LSTDRWAPSEIYLDWEYRESAEVKESGVNFKLMHFAYC